MGDGYYAQLISLLAHTHNTHNLISLMAHTHNLILYKKKAIGKKIDPDIKSNHPCLSPLRFFPVT